MTLRLDEAAVACGYRLETLATTASTNDDGLERAAQGDPGRLWVVAGEQTGGRGRRGRHWASPPGNLYASLLLIDPAPPARIAELGFVAGVAAATAVRALGVPPGSFALKWPNDLVAGGAKFSGLLLETRQVQGRLAAVVGFGINCAHHPTGLAYATTDLSEISGRAVTPADVFGPLSRSMAAMLDVWEGGERYAQIRTHWLDFAAGLGEVIHVDAGTRRHDGIFAGIDQHGRLLLETDAGRVAIDAGDVFLARH